MILLVSNERDLTTDYIVLELQRRNSNYLRLNSERLASARVRYQPTVSANAWSFDFAGQQFSTADISAGYFRRPGAPIAMALVEKKAEREYCEQEWASLLRSLYTVIGNRWLNSPSHIALAEDKPRQLMIAASLGFEVPDTLITNEYDAALAFIEGGATVAKPIHEALLNGGDSDIERVIFTSQIDAGLAFGRESIEAAPLILQREIPKTCDIRATVIGNRVFAAAIGSQTRLETSVDWRRGSHADLPHKRHELPEDIAAMCINVTKELGLRFAAVDLVLDRDGQYWFLEANPNGQWAWIENRTGLPIASAIVDTLLSISIDRT